MSKQQEFKLKDKIGMGIILVALILFLGQKMFLKEKSVDKKEVMIDNKKLKVEIADNDSERYRGLSDREQLGKNEGMLFIHNGIGRYQYVMRRMKFDLDFIFVKEGEVVDIVKNVPKNFQGIIRGATEYDKVVEVPAGWVDENNIKLGEKFLIKE
jgi:uncharacterized membrane protein (UPF0127 family)